MITMVSCQKGPTRHAYAWQIGPFWQDTFELSDCMDCWAEGQMDKAIPMSYTKIKMPGE